MHKTVETYNLSLIVNQKYSLTTCLQSTAYMFGGI